MEKIRPFRTFASGDHYTASGGIRHLFSTFSGVKFLWEDCGFRDCFGAIQKYIAAGFLKKILLRDGAKES